MQYNIKWPEFLQSSKGNGKLSRTVKGITGLVIFTVVSTTALTEQTAVSFVNQLAMTFSAIYALYGAFRKVYNQLTGEHK